MQELQTGIVMETGLQNMAALAKTQQYLFNRYGHPENEPWCYHTQFSYHLQVKQLSLPLFHKALRSVLDRHPVLKTVFLLNDGEIKQAVDPNLALPVIFKDISQLTERAQHDWLENYLLADRNQPIDWKTKGKPLFRTYLIKRSEHSLQLVLAFNHAIWDGWSLAVLLREIFAHYHALKLKPTLHLQPADYDYHDFLEYEVKAGNSLPSKAFWHDHLKDHRFFTPLKSKANSNYQTYKPVEVVLSPALTAGLNQAQQQLRVTLKAIFIAQFIRIVELETHLDSTTIGVVSNGRSIGLKNPLTTLGLLWNLAPLHASRVADDLTHVKNVNKLLAEVSAHASYPLLNILEDQGTDQLFHAAFNYINFEGAGLLPTVSDIEFLEVGGLDKFHFPLHLLVGKNPFSKNISLVLNYDTRCYTRAEAENKLAQYIAGLTKTLTSTLINQG